MRKLALGIGALALAACGSQPEHAEEPAATASATTAPATTATPDLAACARPAPLEASEPAGASAITS